LSALVDKLFRVASVALDRGQPSLFKRLAQVGEHIARSDRTDTDGLLDEALQDERADEPPVEVVDADDDGKTEPPGDDEDRDEDEDVEGFAGFPMGALPQKERRKGPHPKDVGVARPDWWNPR
jgi:hypothetical protein